MSQHQPSLRADNRQTPSSSPWLAEWYKLPACLLCWAPKVAVSRVMGLQSLTQLVTGQADIRRDSEAGRRVTLVSSSSLCAMLCTLHLLRLCVFVLCTVCVQFTQFRLLTHQVLEFVGV